jgi:hypothetical protein
LLIHITNHHTSPLPEHISYCTVIEELNLAVILSKMSKLPRPESAGAWGDARGALREETAPERERKYFTAPAICDVRHNTTLLFFLPLERVKELPLSD